MLKTVDVHICQAHGRSYRIVRSDAGSSGPLIGTDAGDVD